MIVDVALFKKHSRTDDFADDDDLIETYLRAAETAVLKEIRRSEEELRSDDGEVPEPIQVAIMQMAAHWYATREVASSVKMSRVPATLEVLLKPYVKL
jgi:uncharacterized phage protein (predicted DNA packaging)